MHVFDIKQCTWCGRGYSQPLHTLFLLHAIAINSRKHSFVNKHTIWRQKQTRRHSLPRGTTEVPRAAASGDLHASTGSTTINSFYAIFRVADRHQLAGDLTQPLSLPLQSLGGGGGTCGGVPTVLAGFPSGTSCDLYHMLYTCRYCTSVADPGCLSRILDPGS